MSGDIRVLVLFAVVFFLAFLIEALVEYFFGKPFDVVEKLKPYKWLLMYIPPAFGVLFSFIYQLDMINLLSRWLGQEMPITNASIALTGLSIGRGASFIHDIWQRFFVKKPLE